MVGLGLSSETKKPQKILEAVSNQVQQRLAQVDGVGDVEIGGGSLPAIRVDLIPFQLNRYGISLEDIRAAIEATNANRPKGAMEGDGKHYQIYRSEEHTSELQSLMRTSYAVFCLKKKTKKKHISKKIYKQRKRTRNRYSHTNRFNT